MAGADPFTEDQVERLLAAAAQRSRRECAWVTLLVHTGFRAQELLKCRVADVADGIRVRSQLTIERRRMKGGRGPRRRAVTARTVPISTTAGAAVFDYLQARAVEGTLQPEAPLFLSRNGRPLSIWRANAILRELIIAAGFDGEGRFSTHSARKAWAHKLYSETGDLLLVRDGLLHSTVVTTERYLSRRYRQVFEITRNLWAAPAMAVAGCGRSGGELPPSPVPTRAAAAQ